MEHHHHFHGVFPIVKEQRHRCCSQVVSDVISGALEFGTLFPFPPADTTGILGLVNGIIVCYLPLAPQVQDVDRILRLSLPFNSLFLHPNVGAVYCGWQTTAVSCFNIDLYNFISSLAPIPSTCDNTKQICKIKRTNKLKPKTIKMLKYTLSYCPCMINK